MNVVNLTYTIKSLLEDRKVEAKASPPIRLGDFDCSFVGTTITAVPARPFSHRDEARAALEPILRDLETEWDLRGLPIRFEFSSAHMVADMESGEPQHHEVFASDTVRISDSASLEAKVTFSPPTGEYRATPIVDLLRYRWLSPAKGITELPASAAYALLTFLEQQYGGRVAVANRLNVSRKVLSRAASLSSQSDPLQGRKLKGPAEPLTPEELGWLNAFISAIGKRAATVESGNPSGLRITLDDPSFPQLPME